MVVLFTNIINMRLRLTILILIILTSLIYMFVDTVLWQNFEIVEGAVSSH